MKRKIKGSYHCPRLYIFKSNKHIYAQIIDDDNNNILTSSSTISKEINTFANCTTAKQIGQQVAKKLKEKGITKIIFDRGYNKYHGQIKALAEATREEGINF
uniref:Large ribosomal subunit protein uL18c n=1 Tax=Dipterocladia arabiensis TaxID=2007176 RepID=A0A1Z1M097_9FLOR|nr:ribosomal protein L18 [Dipterocladia arabiensis]ARW59436.1 ribosomal protein L18 [Dipterocladia arabiensis]